MGESCTINKSHFPVRKQYAANILKGVSVSRTDNTRSPEIQIADSTTVLIGGTAPIPIIGGIKSAGKPSKPSLKYSTRQQRQARRKAEYDARTMLDKEAFHDDQTIKDKRRSVTRQKSPRIIKAMKSSLTDVSDMQVA